MGGTGKKAALEALRKVVKEEQYKCIRCGECRTVCPVFRETPAERYTARGKVALGAALAHGELEFTDHAREALDNCLLCTGCASQCSSGVRADRVILAARRAFAQELGMKPLKKAISLALSQPGGLLNAESRVGALLQPLLFKAVPRSSGLYRRFSMPFIDEEQYIPRLADVPFRKRVSRAGEPDRPTVIFFTGCMANYAMTGIADSVVKVLLAAGYAVEVPSEQGCCGTPMLAGGDRASARRQAVRNIRALARRSLSAPIVVACSSCGHMLKHGYKDAFGDDPELAAHLENIAERTRDISEFLVREVGEARLRELSGNPPLRGVTYHDPCHLRKAQGVAAEPRLLLDIATQGGLREMCEPEACCGMGGTYFLGRLDLSRRIQRRKLEDALGTGAACIATGCPGCMMQLRDGARRARAAALDVRHVVEIFADSLK